jgi:hypothetical protein
LKEASLNADRKGSMPAIMRSLNEAAFENMRKMAGVSPKTTETKYWKGRVSALEAELEKTEQEIAKLSAQMRQLNPTRFYRPVVAPAMQQEVSPARDASYMLAAMLGLKSAEHGIDREAL